MSATKGKNSAHGAEKSPGHGKNGKSPRHERQKEKSDKDGADRERERSLDRESLQMNYDVLDAVLEEKLSPTTTAREQEALDQLAMLFTIQEERCIPDRELLSREGKLSRSSLTHSQSADASFIYQRIDFDLLARCVPGFVRTHLNKNGRYLPETFILRVNYLRRRRALGVDGGAVKQVKESMSRNCSDVTSTTPRAASSRGQPVKASTSNDTRTALVSG